MKRIRIMHVIYGFGTGGTEKVLLQVVTGLDPSRFEHVICSVVSQTPLVDSSQITIISLAKPPHRRAILVPAIARAIQSIRPDIIHSRNWAAIEAIVAGRLMRVPFIVHSEHGRDLDTIDHQPGRRKLVRRLCYRCADRIFAVSQELKNYYIAETGSVMERCQIIPNGVNALRFRPDPAARERVRRGLGMSEDRFVVGTVARFDPVKDHRTLFRACELALQKGTNLHLVLVGDGPERERLEIEVRRSAGLRGRVIFAGITNDVPAWLNSFDAFVLSSFSEGMSNTLLEAMATAVPPVASRVGSNCEIVQHNLSGLLFEPGNALELASCLSQLASDAEQRSAIGAAARARVQQNYRLDRMLELYAKLYDETAGRIPSPKAALGGAASD